MKHRWCLPSAPAIRWVSSGALLLLALLTSLGGHAQRFWQTTPAPFGLKNGLLAVGDSTLLTAVPAGLLRSTNRGRTWALVRRTRPVHTLYATRRGLLLAGGIGWVYRSSDAGATWDSVVVATTHPITTFADTPQGDLLLGTGGYDAQGNDVGDGVFYSTDAGRTWAARNAGLGAARSVAHVLADRQGRLFAATTEYDDPGRQPGLYWSANSGQQWQHLPLRLSNPQWPQPVTVCHVTSLVITPQDSLVCSFTGTLLSARVQGNFIKSLAQVTDPAIGWLSLLNRGRWWDHDPVLPLHIALDGTWYTSRVGLNSGGTLHSATQGRHWTLHNQGVGVGSSGLRERQFFAEFSSGQLFMVQQSDDQVYYRQSTVLATAPARNADAVQLFPNPTTGLVQVVSASGQRIVSIAVYDRQGRQLSATRPAAASTSLDLAAEVPGLYLVAVQLADGRYVRQKILKQ